MVALFFSVNVYKTGDRPGKYWGSQRGSTECKLKQGSHSEPLGESMDYGLLRLHSHLVS